MTGSDGTTTTPTFTVVATLMQSLALHRHGRVLRVATRRPRPWHFGLRRARLWPAIGWAALGMVAFYVFAAVYPAAVQPDAEQTVTEDLGADEGTFGLIAAGLMIVCVAPVAEEFFFRGFFFRALRNRYSLLAAAAIDGRPVRPHPLHFSGSDTRLILPVLALLGFMFCLVYERTGSLFPASRCTRSTTRSPTAPRRTAGRSRRARPAHAARLHNGAPDRRHRARGRPRPRPAIVSARCGHAWPP